MAGEGAARAYVLDASVAAKVLFDEPGSDVARALVADADFVTAPDFAQLEIANICVKRARTRAITKDQALEASRDGASLYDTFEPIGALVEDAAAFALSGMSATYDAAYAALAARRGLTLITADARFAASLAGVAGAPSLILVASADRRVAAVQP